ncbi:hypothetical protein ACWDCC_38205 [Streptomyces sp. NPDC001102]
MYEYEIAQFRSAELIRRADDERLAREAVRGARREAARRSTESESHTSRHRRLRFARAA